jgi:hypothetical protein
MMLGRDQAEHAAVSLRRAAGWVVLETSGALTVEQRDRTERGMLRCLHRIEAALAPGTARVTPAAVSG